MNEQQGTPEERLQAELDQISAQLDVLPFRQDSKRLSELLRSDEAHRQLSRETRRHLADRIILNTINATLSDPEIERLILREHEIVLILRRRKNLELFAVDAVDEDRPGPPAPDEKATGATDRAIVPTEPETGAISASNQHHQRVKPCVRWFPLFILRGRNQGRMKTG